MLTMWDSPGSTLAGVNAAPDKVKSVWPPCRSVELDHLRFSTEMCSDSRKHKPLHTSFQRVDDSNLSAAESEEILKFNTASHLAKIILLYILYDGILVFSFKYLFDRNNLQIKLRVPPNKNHQKPLNRQSSNPTLLFK